MDGNMDGKRSWLTRIALISLGSVLLAGGSFAQGPGPPPQPGPQQQPPDLSGFSVIPFNFGPPGARSLGMGGTFIAIADDATASEANPAGLVNLSRPEVSVHLRHTSFEIKALDLNAEAAQRSLNDERRPASPLMQGRTGNSFLDPTLTRFEDAVSEISFASYVKPLRHFTVSVFFQRSAEFAGSNTWRAFDDLGLDLYQTRQQLDLDLENMGVSLAWKLGERVSAGVSVRASRLRLAALQETRVDYSTDAELAFVPSGSSLEAVEALEFVDQQVNREVIDHDDTQVTWNAGILINPNGRFSFGMVYKAGGSYEMDGQVSNFGCTAFDASGRFLCEPPPMAGMRNTRDIDVPDFYGAGITWRVTNRFRLAFDVNRITYSDLAFGTLENPNADPERTVFEPVEDTTEMHFGLEYIVFAGAKRLPITVRAGAYTSEDHDGFRVIDSEETVVTFGFGTVLMEKFQIDVAGQSSDRGEAAILSMVYRF